MIVSNPCLDLVTQGDPGLPGPPGPPGQVGEQSRQPETEIQRGDKVRTDGLAPVKLLLLYLNVWLYAKCLFKINTTTKFTPNVFFCC